MLILITGNLNGQKLIDSLEAAGRLDSLKIYFSKNKKIKTTYDLEIFTALSYYPELANTRITIKNAKIKTTLNARPTILSTFVRKRSKRKYVIRINNKKLDSIIQFKDISFNAKVGVLGHEFAHIYDYNKRSFFGIIKRFFAYTTAKSKSRFEKEIDSITIERGLGYKLLEWANYVLHESNATESYKQFKKDTYLTPEEIRLKLQEIKP